MTSLYPHLFFKAVFMTCSHSFPYSLVLNVRALKPCILILYDFLTEHVIIHNHKLNATLRLSAIAAVDNNPLPPFASLALVPSPHPSDKHCACYLYFLEECVLSSERYPNDNAYVDLLFSLGWNVIETGA